MTVATDHVLIDLPCGCQDVYYTSGRIDREHDHVVCDGQPIPNPCCFWNHDAYDDSCACRCHARP